MFIARRFYSTRLTFFTKQNCQLCDKLKLVINNLQKNESVAKMNIEYQYIDIMKPENEKWHDMYVYDIPVLHIDREDQVKPIKFMHRLDEAELLEELTQEL